MNLAEFATSNGDFMGGLQSRQDARDAAQTAYEEARRANADHFYSDCLSGRGEQIARVIGGRSYTLAQELYDQIDSAELFRILQAAMWGKDVGDAVRDLVNAAADKFGEAITEWVE